MLKIVVNNITPYDVQVRLGAKYLRAKWEEKKKKKLAKAKGL